MRWLDGITDSVDIEFKQAPGVGEGQRSLACCSPWGYKELDMTEWLNWWWQNEKLSLSYGDWLYTCSMFPVSSLSFFASFPICPARGWKLFIWGKLALWSLCRLVPQQRNRKYIWNSEWRLCRTSSRRCWVGCSFVGLWNRKNCLLL